MESICEIVHISLLNMLFYGWYLFVFFFRLFAGVTLRTAWISLGGAVFFGFYEKAKNVLLNKLES